MSRLVARYREMPPERVEEFVAKGYAQRHFFPHRIYYLPKGGPDGLKLARRMVGSCRPDQLVEVVLFATAPVVDEFPADLFFDDDVMWHRQHFGRVGQVASANLVRQGSDLHSMVHISDLVQRIGRRREHKTRVENRFKGWAHLLLNAILNFASESGVRRIHFASAELARTHTDRARHVEDELFDRVYDRTVCGLFDVTRHGDWWLANVEQNRARLVVPVRREETIADEKLVCVAHDIERGHGHRTVAPDFAAFADATAAEHLNRMLALEADARLKVSYNVVGVLFPDVHDAIKAGGHTLGFHSFDHPTVSPASRARALTRRLGRLMTGSDGGKSEDQLTRCREIDYRLRGYRPPQSRLTAETSAGSLCFHNFEWLASSAYSLKMREPKMEDGIVWIPIQCDDFELYSGALAYPDWERTVLQRLSAVDVAVFSLHDCYGHLWLDGYPQLLERVAALGRLQTLDEIANRFLFSRAL